MTAPFPTCAWCGRPIPDENDLARYYVEVESGRRQAFHTHRDCHVAMYIAEHYPVSHMLELRDRLRKLEPVIQLAVEQATKIKALEDRVAKMEAVITIHEGK